MEKQAIKSGVPRVWKKEIDVRLIVEAVIDWSGWKKRKERRKWSYWSRYDHLREWYKTCYLTNTLWKSCISCKAAAATTTIANANYLDKTDLEYWLETKDSHSEDRWSVKKNIEVSLKTVCEANYLRELWLLVATSGRVYARARFNWIRFKQLTRWKEPRRRRQEQLSWIVSFMFFLSFLNRKWETNE